MRIECYFYSKQLQVLTLANLTLDCVYNTFSIEYFNVRITNKIYLQNKNARLAYTILIPVFMMSLSLFIFERSGTTYISIRPSMKNGQDIASLHLECTGFRIISEQAVALFYHSVPSSIHTYSDPDLNVGFHQIDTNCNLFTPVTYTFFSSRNHDSGRFCSCLTYCAYFGWSRAVALQFTNTIVCQ